VRRLGRRIEQTERRDRTGVVRSSPVWRVRPDARPDRPFRSTDRASTSRRADQVLGLPQLPDAGGANFDDGIELFFVKLGRREVGVRVHLRSSFVGVDDSVAVHDVRLFLSTTPAELQAFGRELANLVDGTSTVVTLPAEDF
jgi:hypothetical protein